MNLNALLLLLLLCAGGCVPSRLSGVQLTPVTGEVARIDERLVTRAAADSLMVVASFEREDMNYLALDIEVKNQSGRVLDFDPTQFRFVALSLTGDTLRNAESLTPGQFGAVANPTHEAAGVVERIAREHRRIKTARVINTVLLVAAMASDASSAAGRQAREKEIRARVAHDGLYNLIQAKRVIDHKTFDNRMQQYDFELYRWRELALRRTYLQPGESVRGFLYLPKMETASFVRLLYTRPATPAIGLTFRQDTYPLRSR